MVNASGEPEPAKYILLIVSDHYYEEVNISFLNSLVLNNAAELCLISNLF